MVTLFLSATTPTLEILNWAGINEVDLSATGGTQDPMYTGDGTEVAMDNTRSNSQRRRIRMSLYTQERPGKQPAAGAEHGYSTEAGRY